MKNDTVISRFLIWFLEKMVLFKLKEGRGKGEQTGIPTPSWGKKQILSFFPCKKRQK